MCSGSRSGGGGYSPQRDSKSGYSGGALRRFEAAGGSPCSACSPARRGRESRGLRLMLKTRREEEEELKTREQEKTQKGDNSEPEKKKHKLIIIRGILPI